MGCKKCSVEESCPMDAAKVIDGILQIDKDVCNNCGLCVGKCHFDAIEGGQVGYKVYIGGRWGKRTAHGKPLGKIFTDKDEALDVIEKPSFYTENRVKPESACLKPLKGLALKI